MNIDDEEDICNICLDTGEYFNGKKMLVCSCEFGDIIKERNDGGNGEDDSKTTESEETKT